jgi:hypothetical protein
VDLTVIRGTEFHWKKHLEVRTRPDSRCSNNHLFNVYLNRYILFQTAFPCPSRPTEITDLESQCIAEYKAMKRAKCNTTGKFQNE